MRKGRRLTAPPAPGVCAAGLSPRMVDILAHIGRHPLYTADELAHVAPGDVSRQRQGIERLRRYDLITAFYYSDERARRYVMTEEGLAFLAARAALPPAAYARAAGMLTDGPTRPGLNAQYTNRAHTDGVRALHLAFARDVAAEGGSLEWWGEWASPYLVRGLAVVGAIRPDAELDLSLPGMPPAGMPRVYIEYDRSHQTQGDTIATKIAHYYDVAAALPAYASTDADGRPQTERPIITVAFVTEESRQRAFNILDTAISVWRKYPGTRVRMRAAWLPDVLEKGPLHPVWYKPEHPEPIYLGPEVEVAQEEAMRAGQGFSL